MLALKPRLAKWPSLIGAISLALLSACANAGPFGLHMGMTQAELAQQGVKLEPIKIWKHIYLGTGPSLVHEGKKQFFLIITPKYGLCRIVVGGALATGADGKMLRDSYEQRKAWLSEQYGPPDDEFKGLKPGSLWSADTDWMMALFTKERQLASVWKGKSRKLPDDLSDILLNGVGQSRTQGHADISYSFLNYEKCHAEL